MTSEFTPSLFDTAERRAYARWELLDEHAEAFIYLDPNYDEADVLDLEGFRMFIQGLGYEIADGELTVALTHRRNMMRYGNEGEL